MPQGLGESEQIPTQRPMDIRRKRLANAMSPGFAADASRDEGIVEHAPSGDAAHRAAFRALTEKEPISLATLAAELAPPYRALLFSKVKIEKGDLWYQR